MQKDSDTKLVTEFIQKLEIQTSETIAFLRQTILETDKEIGEQIKWNSPSFYYTGAMKSFNPKEYKRDIVVINVHRGNILLVFPTGAKVKENKVLDAVDYPDGRKIIKIANIEDAKAKHDAIETFLKDWLITIEK
jgi:hypothetical protein